MCLIHHIIDNVLNGVVFKGIPCAFSALLRESDLQKVIDDIFLNLVPRTCQLSGLVF